MGGIEAGALGAYGAYGAALLSTYYIVRTVGRTMYEFRLPNLVVRTSYQGTVFSRKGAGDGGGIPKAYLC